MPAEETPQSRGNHWRACCTAAELYTILNKVQPSSLRNCSTDADIVYSKISNGTRSLASLRSLMLAAQQLFYHNYVWSVNLSLAICMCVYVNTLVIRFNPGSNFRILTLTISGWFVCVHFCRSVSPLTSCYIITSNGLIALFPCFTQVLPYQTYCLLDPNTQVGSCMCVYTAHTACSTLHDTMAHMSSVTPPPGSCPLPHTPLLAFFGNFG